MAGNLVATLIAGPGEPALPDIIATLARSLPGFIRMDWLSQAVACDIAVAGDRPGPLEALLRQAIGPAAIDVVVQPAFGRRKQLLVADLESTIIENEMLDELADFVGLRAHVAEITRRAMNGELDFAAALAERVALLRGLPASVLDAAAGRIRVMPGADRLLATCRGAGVRTALVSGGFTVFAEPVAAALGFDRVIANRLDIIDGRIAGTVASPIVTRQTKRETLLGLASEYGFALTATLAVGDGANDLPMLQAAGLGIAFRAKPAVSAASRWRIDHADLTALLYAQGFPDSEFAAQVGGASQL
jgi:phosphoserine phosphatase